MIDSSRIQTVGPFPQTRVEEFDVTFMGVDEGYDANIVARPLSTSEWIMYAVPAYLSRVGTLRESGDLAHHDYPTGWPDG